MPAATAAAVVTALGATGTAATVVTAVVQIAVVSGINALSAAVLGQFQDVPKPSDVQKIVRENVSSRFRHYGRVHVGGVLTFYESKNGSLYAVITTGHGEINQIIEHRLNNKVVNVSGVEVTDAQYQTVIKDNGVSTAVSAVNIQTRLGTLNQASYAFLTAVFPEWTVDHRQLGCSNVALKFLPVKAEDFSTIYEGNKQPEYSQVIDAAKVYDPRKDSTAGGSGSHRLADPSTWEFSKNAALIIADYIAHEDGFGNGYDKVNWSNIAVEANVSDQTVTTVDGRTVKRWELSGSYALATESRKNVINQMLAACDGFMFQDETGKANLYVGRYIAPTLHLTDDHILTVNGSVGVDPQEATNVIKVVYTETRFDYTETEAAPTKNQAALDKGLPPSPRKFDLYYCPDHNQAARVGKRILSKYDDRWTLSITTNLYGLNAIGERFIKVSISELLIEETVFEITRLKINPQSNVVELGLIEVKESDFNFDASSEEGAPPSDISDTYTPAETPTPSSLATSVETVTLSGTTGSRIKLTWSLPGRPDLSFEAEIKKDSETSWGSLQVSKDEKEAFSGLVSEGETYDLRVRSVALLGRVSDWAETSLTVSSSEAAPSSATSFAGVASGMDAVLTWVNSTSSSFSFAKVYKSSTDDFSTATFASDVPGSAGASASYTDAGLSVGTIYYWIVSLSATGLTSSPTSSVSISIA